MLSLSPQVLSILTLAAPAIAQIAGISNMHICTEEKWRYCEPMESPPLDCTSATENMKNVSSIAIDLGLCCRFYSDDKCGQTYDGWGGDGVWFPGNPSIDDSFSSDVGSYQCRNGTVSCPPAASAPRASSSEALSLASASQALSSASQASFSATASQEPTSSRSSFRSLSESSSTLVSLASSASFSANSTEPAPYMSFPSTCV